MSAGNKKEIEQLIVKLRKQGFTVRETRNQHYAVSKEGERTVFMPKTPSDARGIHRVIAKLKRIGYDRHG